MANLTIKSKFNLIHFFKEEGNANFKKKQYEQSLEFYQHCLSFLDSIYFEQTRNSNDNSNQTSNNETCIMTSIILSNISETHLRLNASNPDLYSHLLSALNCAQISLQINPSNMKSTVRRIVTLYRLGLFEFAEYVTNNTPNMQSNMVLIEKEKKRIENQSVKYHIDRFKHLLLSTDGKIEDNEQEIDAENNVFLRIAAADLIRQNRYDFDDFLCKHFSKTLKSLQVITMVGVFLNWDYVQITNYFVKYLKIFLEDNILNFNKMKQVISQTLKIENTLWPTDQYWKLIIKGIIYDRHEIEWCNILNCSDNGVLNNIYDKYKHKLNDKNIGKIKFKKELNDKNNKNDDYKWIQTEINELKRMHGIDKENIIKLSKVVKQLQKKCQTLNEKMIVVEARDNGEKKINALNKQIYNMQITFVVFVVLIAVLLIFYK
eukprot:404680_1